jgi:cell division protein FtsB
MGMERMQQFQQAYLQAPWRLKVRRFGTFLLVVVSVAIVAGIYLNITARAATVGREIQSMQVRLTELHSVSYLSNEEEEVEEALPIEELKQEIASLEAKLSMITSYDVMEKRARDLGFDVIKPENITYIQVAGYVDMQPANLAPPPSSFVPSPIIESPEYKESLLEWLKVRIVQTSEYLKEVQP